MSDLSFLEDTPVQSEEGDLKLLSEYVSALKEKRQKIDFLEDQLKALKEEERKMSREVIPDFLLSKNLETIGLATGETVQIQKELSVALPKKDILKRKIVLNWIIENGGAGIIKEVLSVEEPETVVFNFLEENGIPFSHDKDIHHSTLKAWFKEQLGMKKGQLQKIEVGDVPTEANLFIYNETKIK